MTLIINDPEIIEDIIRSLATLDSRPPPQGEPGRITWFVEIWRVIRRAKNIVEVSDQNLPF